jgi:hypothetical protein
VERVLSREAYYELAHGLPAEWRASPLFEFVEAMHAKHAAAIACDLAAFARTWQSNTDDGDRPGEAAAQAVTAKLAALGIAVYSPPPSQSDEAPYCITGPRFYVSITRAAEAKFGVGTAPPMPLSLRRALWSHDDDLHGDARVRGLGWTLAPPGAAAQTLHADLWGHEPRNQVTPHDMPAEPEPCSTLPHLRMRSCPLAARPLPARALEARRRGALHDADRAARL